MHIEIYTCVKCINVYVCIYMCIHMCTHISPRVPSAVEQRWPYEWVMTHICMSRVTYYRVIAHTYICVCVCAPLCFCPLQLS